MKQNYPIHTIYLRAVTYNIIRHQKLGHPCDQYLYKDHKYIGGVPKFSNATSKVLDKFRTFIQSKMYKTPPGHGTTCVAIQPYQVLSIEIYFSSMRYDDSYQKNIYAVINGETFWIFITDHFTGMKLGDAIFSKASPISWIRHCLDQYSPTCNEKCIHLDK